MEYEYIVNEIKNCLLYNLNNEVIEILDYDDSLIEKLESLDLVKFIVEVEKVFNCDLSMMFVLETEITINSLIKYLIENEEH